MFRAWPRRVRAPWTWNASPFLIPDLDDLDLRSTRVGIDFNGKDRVYCVDPECGELCGVARTFRGRRQHTDPLAVVGHPSLESAMTSRTYRSSTSEQTRRRFR